MFVREDLERAVDLQRRSYRLLKWTAEGIDRGFLSTRAAHAFTTLPQAASGWIDEHYDNLPPNARPPREDLEAFANLFSTYLYATFDLVEDPGKIRYSPDAHCFCPMCSWLVDAPRLRPKKVKPTHKERARELMRSFGNQIAAEAGVSVPDDLLEGDELKVPLALGAYGLELTRRLRGFSEGTATLALWRTFAWEPTGSPRKGFELTADLLLEAERTVLAALSARPG
ncbi:MAG: hypothetical protein H6738_11750 [Alphaproteobacteria bacterium]|nr:hypothetical protein [Alphaproteobacteria bacterium]MCB9697446.1 hypothetical protein [Alphaproteobacteria bacterium]